MRALFWASLLLIVYAYLGYGSLLWIIARLRPRPVRKQSAEPPVSIVMAVRNEEANLPAKLANLRALEYPKERLQIVVASDGSTDRTADILRDAGEGVVPVLLENSGGKAAALNQAVHRTTGEILVFLDARQSVDLEAVAKLVACFADPSVGAVSGELLLEAPDGAPSEEGLGIYWKIEKIVRKLESASGSVVGVTGAIYAIRRELFVQIPTGTILDDVFVPMNVARQGYRVLFEPQAIARDRIFSEKGKEFLRKVRTLTGNYQLLQLAPWLLTASNPLLFRFISHKLLRLLVPLLLAVLLISSALAAGAFYHAIFALQVLFYLCAVIGVAQPSANRFRPVAIANTFVMLNLAAACAFYNFVTRRREVWI